MSNKKEENKCCCDDNNLSVQQQCLNCNEKWDRQLAYHERVAQCPQHHFSIAICSASYHLCPKCKEQGYYVETNPGLGFFNGYIIKKKTSSSSDE